MLLKLDDFIKISRLYNTCLTETKYRIYSWASSQPGFFFLATQPGQTFKICILMTYEKKLF